MLKTLLKPFASLTLTVILLALSMVLIYAGTLAQVDTDIWDVQHKYFHSFFAKLPLQDLVPRFTDRPRYIGGWVPFPGGYIIGGLLLLNLLAAHAVRFKFSPKDLFLIPLGGLIFWSLYVWQNTQSTWLMSAAMMLGVLFIVTLFLVHNKRAGVIVIHLGLILLLIGEGITSGMAKESRMTIQEGTYANYSIDIRTPELAIVDRSDPNNDVHHVVAAKLLKAGEEVADPELPVKVKVEKYFVNSNPVGASTDPSMPAITDAQGAWTVQKAESVNGLGGRINMPSAVVSLSRDGKDLGRYLLSTIATQPQTIEAGGKTYDVALRFERLYKPYTIYLKDFSFDRYTGTKIARNFSSEVTLTDPSRNEHREVRIWMNHPLRYQGETFYQSGYDERTEKATVLQVVRNPGATFPYIAILISMIGLIIHFGLSLVNFLSKRDLSGAELSLGLVTALGALVLGAGAYVTAGFIGIIVFVAGVAACVAAVFLLWGGRATSASAASAVPPPPPAKQTKGRRELNEGRYELAPQSGFFKARTLVPLSLLVLCAVYVLSHAVQRPLSPDYDLDTFAKLPLSYEGRVQPFDSLGRNALKVLRGRESAVLVETKNGDKVETKIQPVQWLLDVMSHREVARKYRVFAIDHPDVKTLFGLDEKERFFSFEQLAPKLEEFEEKANEANDQRERNARAVSPYQSALLDTANRISLFRSLSAAGGLHAIPPTTTEKDWVALGAADAVVRRGGQADPVLDAFVRTLNAYAEQQPAAFNREVRSYQSLVERRAGEHTGTTAFEAWFNRFDPFTTSIVFYVMVLVLAALSWVGFTKPLARSAFWILCFALLLHTFGLTARIYISGRPPVTNLASASIFVGWGIVILAIGLELIFRNGVGSVLAAVAGIPTLVIAHRLSLDGDTMKVLQAVLDTNIWLATHVVTITLGYAATLLAGLIGIVYVVLGLLTTVLDRDLRKTLARMMYGITCFAILLSFVGTILGGIWADQSWGRFWGWDPKENGAILIVLANALFLHARWGGLVKERGMAILAIFGNIVTVWSFFGTNQLGVGLHAYGAMGATVVNIIMFCSLMLFFIGCGLIPTDSWRSGYADDGATTKERPAAAR